MYFNESYKRRYVKIEIVYTIYHSAKDVIVADFTPLNRVPKLGCKYPQ